MLIGFVSVILLTSLVTPMTVFATTTFDDPLTTLEFTNRGTTFSTPIFQEDGITITGSNDLYILESNGIGVVGGFSDSLIDTDESITLTFDEPIASLTYSTGGCVNIDLDEFCGEAIIETFGVDGSLISIESVVVSSSFTVSDPVDNQLISTIIITADGDGFRIPMLGFTSIPEFESVFTTCGFVEYNLGIIGTSMNDVLNGKNQDSVLILGLDGDDIIFGSDGNDCLIGGNGDDTLKENDGKNSMHGEEGNDILFGGLSNDSMFGGSGMDIILGEDGNDILFGEEGDDTLFGGQDFDSIYGESGNDLIVGGQDDDEIEGGDGNDRIFGGQGNDEIDTTNGGINFVAGGPGNDECDTEPEDIVLSCE